MGMFRTLLLLGITWGMAGCAMSPESSNESINLEKAAKLNVQLGLGYLNQGRYDLALRKLNKALDQGPDISEVHNALAISYERVAEYKLAGEHYRRAVKLDSGDSNALTNYGAFLCKRGDVDGAIEQFDRALTNNFYENPEIAQTNAAICLQSKGKRDEAEKRLLSALRKNAGYPPALFEMGRVRLGQNELRSAQAYLQRYLAVASHTPETLWLGIQIEQQLGDKNSLASYKMLLKNKFPDSSQARWLLGAGQL